MRERAARMREGMRGRAAEADGDALAGGAEVRGRASRTFFSVASIGAAPPPATVGGGAGGLAGALETPPSAAEAAWRTAAAKIDEDTKR